MEPSLSLECERTSKTESPDLQIHAAPLPSGHLSPFRRFTRSRQDLCRWVQANTFAPQWQQGAWHRPLLGYLVAMVLVLQCHLISAHSFSRQIPSISREFAFPNT